jgi:hypothetical protein
VNTKNLGPRWLLIPCLLMLLGCRGAGTQRFTAFAPSQTAELSAASCTVLDVRCVPVLARADYSLGENLHMLAPMPQRMKLDATFHVERVLKGTCPDATLPVHWLRSPTAEQSATLGIPYRGGHYVSFTNGMLLRIGYDNRSGTQFRKLRILVPQD